MYDIDRSILTGTRDDFRLMWQALALTDIVYKIIAFSLITPFVGFVFRSFVRFSGRDVLADADILYFALSPIGLVTTVGVGAIAIGTFAFEIAALMTIVFGRERDERTSVRQALVFTATRALAIVRVTARLIRHSLLVAAPFLLVAGVTYKLMLTEFDINYYLHEQPPVFLVSLGIAVLLVLGLMACLIPLLAARSMALPLILFEDLPVTEALRTSCRRTAGHRLRITLWLVMWLAANTLLSGVLSGLVAWLGETLVSPSLGSLNVIVLAVGGILVLWLLVNFVTTLIGVISFAVLQMNLYRHTSMAPTASLPASAIDQSPGGQLVLRLTRKTIIIGGLLATFASVGIGAWFFSHLDFDAQSTIMAHRGASAAAPENTLAAVARAIEDQADWVEIDVQESADGVVLVVHDSDLKKIGRSGLKIWEATAEQLRQVDIGSWFGPQFSDQRVPTLDEVLELCQGKIRVNIELKYYGHDQQLERRVIDIVKAHGMDDRVVIMSLKKSGIDKFKQLQPDWPAGLLTATAVGDVSRVAADFLAVNVQLATPSFVRAVHRRGKRVFVWTVNDPLTMSIMMGRGVDSIITDQPAMALAVRRERAKMNPIELLLLQVASVIGVASEMELSLDDV